jgi:hypothetical protein
MTGPQDPAAADGGRLRAGHADREQVVEALKDAFVQGRLSRDEFGARAGRALAARTYAELATLTADLPPASAVTRPARLPIPAPARRWPLAKAAGLSGGSLVIGYGALRLGNVFDPGGLGPNPYHSLAPLMHMVVFLAVLAALGFLVNGVATSIKQRRSRRQLPPPPRTGGHALDGEQRRGAGHDPVPPDHRTDAELRACESRQRRRYVPARARRAARGLRPSPGAI